MLTLTFISHKHKVQDSPGFFIKALILKKPALTVGIFTIIAVCWLAYVLRLFER